MGGPPHPFKGKALGTRLSIHAIFVSPVSKSTLGLETNCGNPEEGLGTSKLPNKMSETTCDSVGRYFLFKMVSILAFYNFLMLLRRQG